MGTVESDHTLKCQRFLEVPNWEFVAENLDGNGALRADQN